MKKTTKSLLESLTDLVPEKDCSLVIESRGQHIIASAITLLETIEQHYGEEFGEEMEKRLFSSIRNRNHAKFSRGIKKISESK
jgi:hypothetical protein